MPERKRQRKEERKRHFETASICVQQRVAHLRKVSETQRHGKVKSGDGSNALLAAQGGANGQR